MDTGSALYRKAFEAYMRKGTPIALSLKQQARPTTHYIWRTRGDDRVRPSHAANDGKIFAWDDPPRTGHPGEDYGCRCIAEPYLPEIDEYIDITLSGVSDAGRAWSSLDFVDHYFNGGGRGVTIRETGHLQNIVSEYMGRREHDLKGQIADAARQSKGGSFSYDFHRSYNMTDVVFSVGDTTIGGVFSGRSSDRFSLLELSGSIDFYLRDEFADPLGVGIEIITGQPYPITDQWLGHLEGQVYEDASRSSFKR